SARRVPQRHFPGGVSNWPATKARRVLAALQRIGWVVKRQSGSHRTLSRPDRPDFVFAFHDDEELGPAHPRPNCEAYRSGAHGPIRGSPQTPPARAYIGPWIILAAEEIQNTLR